MPCNDTPTLHHRVAQLAIKTYGSLPRNLKPTVRSNGIPEWTILSAIVLSLPSPNPPSLDDEEDDQPEFQLVSLGTGLKCLPTNRLPPCGDTLHDCHAEVLAKRGFGSFLLEEAIGLCEGRESRFIVKSGDKFKLRDGVGVHLYISALPCGNASSLYTAAHQPISMATLKSCSSTISLNPTDNLTARGRNGYSNTSTLRTKPGRPDSFPSISMSCTDKIASWCILGLQGGLLARLFEPVYLDSIVVGGTWDPPEKGEVVGWEGSKEGWSEAIRKEAEDALHGRLTDIEEILIPPFRLARPTIHLSPLSFPYDKPSIQAGHPSIEPVPQPTSVLQYFVSPTYITEHLYQGCDRRILWKPPGLSPLPEKRRSGACKLEMLRAGIRLQRLLELVGAGESGEEGQRRTYYSWKQGTEYQVMKTLLRGFTTGPKILAGFEKCGPLYITADPGKCQDEISYKGDGSGLQSSSSVKPPFAGWIVAGKQWESFDQDGLIIDSDEMDGS